jgi:hypothetical protein
MADDYLSMEARKASEEAAKLRDVFVRHAGPLGPLR